MPAEHRGRTTDFLPDPTHTFAEAFAHTVVATPTKVALHVVTMVGREPHARAVTFAQLDGMARRAASALHAQGVGAGDRVILSLSAPDLFLAFFLGAQGLGAVPVPLPSAAEALFRAAFQNRIRSVALDCAPRVIVRARRREGESGGQDLGDATAVIEVVANDIQDASREELPGYDLSRRFRETAFLQYTSGTTGDPKGVVITHYNLVANLRACTEAAGLRADDRSFSWLPLFHDMGLVGGLLLPLYLKIPAYVMRPSDFLTRPDAWLRAIDQFKVTLSGGPNFAFNVLARLPLSAVAGLDLSSWRLAFCGGEPIDRDTVEAFTRRFEDYRFRATTFYPVYGLAECTLAAAFPRPGVGPRFDTVDREVLNAARRAVRVDEALSTAATFASVGQAVPSHRLRIVDPEGEDELSEREVGEVVIEGPSLAPRYFQKSDHAGPPRGEFRTGDLGYLADGELFIVDRVKDVLIVAGKTYVPSDIERVAGAVPGVRAGAVVAFALRGSDGTDELYVVAGTDDTEARAPEEIRTEVRWAVQREVGISPKDVCLVRPGALPRTSSGKLARSQCRQAYAGGAFRSVAAVAQGSGW